MKMGKGKIEKSLILDSYIRRRKSNQNTEICEKKKKREALRRVSIVLRKCETLRTSDEIRLLETASDIVKEILERKNRIQQTKERVLEKEDPYETIDAKAKKLADVLSRARHLICYTGAGISTSARIPDYRGSKGIWTLLQKGQSIGQHDLSLAEPTFTHMALFELHRRNILRYVLSQNCDGLHLRSGMPKKSLSEVHGNMYVEVCKYCKPNAEYWRLFDTTEQTARYYHKTNRRCHVCGEPLIDTIVHFGERGSLKWPLNWDGACAHAEKADVILCLGSSLKVLKKYPWLWSMDRPKQKRPKIYVVNLQWTPKDGVADIKINGKCDEVMKLVMKYMNINVNEYNRLRDPIFAHASLLATEELHTVSQPMLKTYKELKGDSCDPLINKLKTEDLSSTSLDEADDLNENCANDDVFESDDKTISSDNVTKKLPNLIPIDRFMKNTDGQTVHLNAADTIESTQLTPNDDTVNNMKIIKDCAASSDTIDRTHIEPIPVNTSQDTQLLVEHTKSQIKNTSNSQQLDDDKGAAAISCKENVRLENNEIVLNKANELMTVNENSSVMTSSQYNNTIESNNFPPIIDHSLPLVNKSDELLNKCNKKIPLNNKTNHVFAAAAHNFCDNRTKLSISKPQLHKPDNIQDTGTAMKTAAEPLIANSNGTKENNSIINHKQLFDVGANLHLDKDCYKNILDYYNKVIDGTDGSIALLPHWYDVNYAYSGLHSIIHPPPNEVDLWGTIIIPLFQLNRKDAECEFCFDNYAEYNCQFYRPSDSAALVKKAEKRNGRIILCECCDFSDNNDRGSNVVVVEEKSQSLSVSNEDDDSSANTDEEKRAKLDLTTFINGEKDLSSPTTNVVAGKIQAGWYGKGYRKMFRRKKRT